MQNPFIVRNDQIIGTPLLLPHIVGRCGIRPDFMQKGFAASQLETGMHAHSRRPREVPHRLLGSQPDQGEMETGAHELGTYRLANASHRGVEDRILEGPDALAWVCSITPRRRLSGYLSCSVVTINEGNCVLMKITNIACWRSTQVASPVSNADLPIATKDQSEKRSFWPSPRP